MGLFSAEEPGSGRKWAPCDVPARWLLTAPSLLAALPVQAFTKRKLRWKRIAEKFGHKSKACKAQYKALTGKPVPDDED